MQVSKERAAVEQLRVAVGLWEAGDNMIAAHTLTCAALELARGLLRARGHTLLLDDALQNHVRPESVKLFQTTLRAAQNFFKHADRDVDRTFEFIPETTEWLLFAAVLGLRQLQVELPVEVAAFQVYVSMLHHEVIVMDDEQRRKIEALRLKISGDDRRETLSMLRDLIRAGAWRQ